MLIGHSGVMDKTDNIAMLIYFVVHTGGIFFFSVSGITTQLQLQRYPARSLLRTYLLILLLGYSYSAVLHPDLYHFFTLEIFQIIASINREGVTILLVEQNARMALSIAQTGLILENGRFVMKGDAAELMADKDVREFYMGVRSESSAKGYQRWKRKKAWR